MKRKTKRLLILAMCGAGLDTVPLPGDASAAQIEGVLLDVAAIALRLNKPLIARSLEITPSGDNRCRANEPCFGYLEIYDSALASPNARAPRLDIRILEKRTNREMLSGDMDLTTFRRPGDSTMPVIMQAPVRGIPAGAYSLEIRVASESGSAHRTVDFEVE